MLNNDVNPKTLSRLELLKLAHTLNVSDADVMTRAELRAAIERASRPEPRPAAQPVTWLGVARRLLASIVEQGLHLPDAAAVIRGETSLRPFPGGPPPVATVTLARIYAAQGHLERAISTIDEVLESDPDHDLARDLRAQLQTSLEQRRQQEREQRATDAAAASAAAAREAEEAAEEESSPASDLLGAVPDAAEHAGDALASDEITLSGGAPALATAPLHDAAAASNGSATSDVSAASDAPPSEAAPTLDAPLPSEAAPTLDAPLPSEAAPTLDAPLLSDALLSTVSVASDTRSPSTPEPVVPEPVVAAPAVAEQIRSEPAVAEPVSEPSAGPPASMPLGAAPASTAPVPSAPIAIEARPAGLVLIETGEPSTYLYWELATPPTAPNGNGSEPHWVCVVTHTPGGAGSKRRERRFPVYRASGAVRLEGLSRHAIVRAKLSRGEAPEAPPLVVASSVWTRETSALARSEPRFLPHPFDLPPVAQPAALAARAAVHLADAAPVYF
jgi:hypothetical protein